MTVLYAQTSDSLSTSSAQLTAIPGLALQLPGGDGITAIVTLNLPNPYAQGNNYPGAMLGISINGQTSPVIASFTYGIQNPPSTNRMPTTLVVGVPLTIQPQTILGMWCGVRGSTVQLDSPATISATV